MDRIRLFVLRRLSCVQKLILVAGLATALLLIPIAMGAPSTLDVVQTAQPAIGGAVPDLNQRPRAPILGADETFSSDPYPLIQGWQDKNKGEAMVSAFKAAGLRSLRLGFIGVYSPVSASESEKVKAASKLSNEFPWFPFSDYAAFIGANGFTTVVAINVEEGPGVARSVVEDFKRAGAMSKLVAIELSNEPQLSQRPWLPEDYADRAAAIIEALTPMGVRFGLPLTVGREKKTPTRLSDDEWNSTMLSNLARRIDLRTRSDIFGVIHLYGRGVGPGVIKLFDRAAHPYAPKMRYLVTEFNIRSNLTGNPHLTNAYAMEFARRLAGMMAQPEIEAMYVHSVPFHAILYWADGKRIATVVGRSDPKLKGDDMSYGWHLTPAGKVYGLYSDLAWNGQVIEYHQMGDQAYWAVEPEGGGMVITVLNSKNKEMIKHVKIGGSDLKLSAAPKSIVCYDRGGRELRRLSLGE
jgi:hypothetical protein